jgi:hypothetical protein
MVIMSGALKSEAERQGASVKTIRNPSAVKTAVVLAGAAIIAWAGLTGAEAQPADPGVRCVDASTEVNVIEGDMPSTRTEAISRAKWEAVSKVADIRIKSTLIIQNDFVDEMITQKAGGVVASYKVLSEKVDGNIFKLSVNACVDTSAVKNVGGLLSRNDYVTVFIAYPRQEPDKKYDLGVYVQSLNSKLIEQGYTPVEVKPNDEQEAKSILQVNDAQNMNFNALKSITSRYLSRMVIYGKLGWNLSSKKGEDIGDGMELPLNCVISSVSYKILTTDKDGNMIVIGSGYEESKGFDSNIETAVKKSLKNLAQKSLPLILDDVSKYVKSSEKKVDVIAEGVDNLDINFRVKSDLLSIPWVSCVNEKGLGKYLVCYPENTIYLANSIKQKRGYSVTGFSPYEIKIKVR